jgi:hypothetical protein
VSFQLDTKLILWYILIMEFRERITWHKSEIDVLTWLRNPLRVDGEKMRVIFFATAHIKNGNLRRSARAYLKKYANLKKYKNQKRYQLPEIWNPA